VRAGTDVTLITYGATVRLALRCAERVAAENVSVEVIDVRTLLPLDIDCLTQSVNKTGRCVVLHEAPRTCGYGAELVSQIAERCFWNLDAPPVRVTGFDTPFPYALEDDYMPEESRVLEALRAAVG
jgi:2-oxoisovalerate dehydrogenase E1 component beta subunit